MENTEWLMKWYQSNCDGDWEHTYGIKITTIDNPGWMIRVDLSETSHEGKQLSINLENSETDWYVAKCDGHLFEAFGDPAKLDLLIDIFRKLVEKGN